MTGVCVLHNDEFLKWLNDKYGSYGLVQATHGAIHDYLGMTIDFLLDGAVKIDMIDYLAKTCDEFPEPLEHMKEVPSAAPVDLFAACDTSAQVIPTSCPRATAILSTLLWQRYCLLVSVPVLTWEQPQQSFVPESKVPTKMTGPSSAKPWSSFSRLSQIL